MTLTDARPFAEHLRVLRERLQHLTGIGTDAEASAGGDAHLTVSPGHATITGSDTARAEIAWSVQIELSLWGAESLEDAGPGAVDPFLDDAAAALLSVTSVLRTSVETVEGGVLHSAKPSGRAGLVAPGEDEPGGVSVYRATWEATLLVTAAMPAVGLTEAPSVSRPARPAGSPYPSAPPDGIPLEIHL
ncbi:MAG: hypothetical protein CMM84_03765 [Rhodothermaceae bacterium]|nr:hypothetical protein [Rhodothermaceae bacterium]MBC15334.1 hypothetical protein [Rhodothermaceae bacterium]